MTASGQGVYNEGQKEATGTTQRGLPINMKWQVAEIQRPLASIGKICEAGNVAVFTETGGFVAPIREVRDALSEIEKKRSVLEIRRGESGVYHFDIWVNPGGDGKKNEHPGNIKLSNRFNALSEPGFPGHGRTS